MFVVYILKSEKTGKHYIGCTNDLERRIKEHNSESAKSTYVGRPWKLLVYKVLNEQEEAYKEEKLVKSYKGGNAFKKIINGEVPKWIKGTHC